MGLAGDDALIERGDECFFPDPAFDLSMFTVAGRDRGFLWTWKRKTDSAGCGRNARKITPVRHAIFNSPTIHGKVFQRRDIGELAALAEARLWVLADEICALLFGGQYKSMVASRMGSAR